MKNCNENLPEEYENDGNTYCHGVVNCKYYHGECVFMDMGSGDPDDMPCRVREQQVIQEFNEWQEERQKAFEEALKERPQGDTSSMELVAGKCPIEAGGNCPLKSQNEWVPVSEKLPEEKINPMTNDFELVLCSTVWDVVRPYKYGKPIGHDKAHFWSGGGIMDEYVTAWQPLPEPYVDARRSRT